MPPSTFEAVVAEGLEAIVRRELRRLDASIYLHRLPDGVTTPGVVTFDYAGSVKALLTLRTVQSIYLVQTFAVPRPKALMGDEHMRALLRQIQRVRSAHADTAFESLVLSAAGSDSAVLTRFKSELATHTGLRVVSGEGDLQLRLRRPPEGDGWQVLVRISPRPLATRSWRVFNLEGALNASVAHAMALLTQPKAGDVFVNLACGSGTLLIERLTAGPVQRAIGCDNDENILAWAQTNLAASGFGGVGELHTWDATALPLADASVDALCADLPFGNLVGSHDENVEFYPALLREAARVACPGARCVIISHEVRLMEQTLDDTNDWEIEQVLRVVLSGLHPRIFVLQRRAGHAAPRSAARLR